MKVMEVKASNEALINPRAWKGAPKLDSLTLMCAVLPDVDAMVKGLKLRQTHPLPMNKAYFNKDGKGGCVAGPMMGAPYAAYVLEQLIASGAQRIVFLGWCGAVSPDLKIGDVIVPSSAFVDEGTSVHYSHREIGTIVRSFPDEDLADWPVPSPGTGGDRAYPKGRLDHGRHLPGDSRADRVFFLAGRRRRGDGAFRASVGRQFPGGRLVRPADRLRRVALRQVEARLQRTRISENPQENHRGLMQDLPSSIADISDPELLVQWLEKYNEAYRAGEPMISDAHYDLLVERLREIAPGSCIFVGRGR